jgi:uncharacterized protein YndB with AHSA1/START domain
LLDDHRYQWHWASIPGLDVQLCGCVFNVAHTVKRSVVLDAPPSEVWDAVTDAGLLCEWLAPEVELEPEEGGELVCRFEDGEERRGEVELVEEAERLAFSWWREDSGPSRVEFIIDAIADGTQLTVIETARRRDDMSNSSRSRADASARVAHFGPSAGWAARLGALRLALGRLVFA